MRTIIVQFKTIALSDQEVMIKYTTCQPPTLWYIITHPCPNFSAGLAKAVM